MKNINTKENWKWVAGYEGRYKVSSFGRVKSFVRDKVDGKLLKLSDNRDGYKKIDLRKEGKRTTTTVHRLVAMAFIPNPENKPQVNHIDEDKTNNNISNLEWTTVAENINYGTRTERMAKANQKPVRNITTGVIYESGKAAGIELNIDASSISKCCKGRYKTCGGWEWEYVQ